MQAESTEYTIGGRLRRLLRLRNQSIRDFSEATGIPYRTLQDYLAGKAKPGADQLGRIAAAGVDVNLLLTGKTRRTGYTVRTDAPADDEVYYILADIEILEAIDRKAKDTITALLKEHLKPDDDLTFETLLMVYLSLLQRLADIFARTNPPIEQARKVGMSVSKLVDSILEASTQIAVARMLAEHMPRG